MIKAGLRFVDFFVPEALRERRSDLSLARNFVFTHIVGPAMGQSIAVFLFFADPEPGVAFFTVCMCIAAFWTLPLVLKFTGRIEPAAYASSQLLIFTSLFGAFFYGGISSPFMSWMLVALLLGFFYLSGRPLMILGGMALQFLGFLLAYLAIGHFPDRVAHDNLDTVNLISVFGALVYMSWMSIFYAEVIQQRSEIEREADRHRATANRLRAAMEEAEQANRNKSIFLAKMSHELRTPLNAVIGYSELLLEDGEMSDMDAQKLGDLKRINGAGRHLLGLVTDVLDLSHIETDRVDVRVDTFAVARFVADLASTTESLVMANGNAFALDVAADAGEASTDQLKLRQCLMNLLGNAAKFTQGGEVRLTVARTSRDGADWLSFAVADTGIGISPAGLDNLFKRFSQATEGTAQAFGGTGLGLVITKQLANLLGGDVDVASREGEGSVFTLNIPAALQVAGAKPVAIAA
jgi:signal transduction histidine kinase